MAATDVVHSTPAQPSPFGSTLSAGLLGLAFFAFTAVSWAILPWSNHARPEMMLAIWLNIVVMLLAIVFEARRRPYSLHLMHLLALYLFLGAASLFQYSRGRLGVGGDIKYMQPEIATTIVSVTLWLVGYLGAYEAYRLFVRSPRGPELRFLSRAVTPLRATVVSALALLALGYLAAIGLAGAETRGAAEGAVLDYASQAASAQYSQALSIFLNMALRAFPIVALLTLLLVLVRVPRARTALAGLLVLLLVGLTLFANNPFAAPRMTFATFVIGFAAPFYLRRHRTAWGLAIIAVAGIALLPALHETRYVEKLDEVIDYVGLVSPLDYLATNSDVDSLGMTALCVRWLESHDYKLGAQSLGSLVFWFPRAFWPGKPIETGAMVTRDLGFSFTNLAPPIQSDAIIDFGLLGVPFVAALYGLLFSRLDRCYWDSKAPRQAVRVIDCIYPLWIGCVLFMTRGGSFAAFTFTAGFSAWLVLLGIGARQPAATDSTQRP